MTEPTVACIMLANGRPEMVKRAIWSFLAQTYAKRQLFILNSGGKPFELSAEYENVNDLFLPRAPKVIGELRNIANRLAFGHDIIAHWDSDDWSHPDRLKQQVALLTAQTDRPGVVAYNDMLFWDSTSSDGEAWIYRSPNPRTAVGTSLCYWRAVWLRVPFGPEHHGEDTMWMMRLATARVATRSVSSMGGDPKMIAAIHGENTCSKIIPGAAEWWPAPEWNAHCREVMNA